MSPAGLLIAVGWWALVAVSAAAWSAPAARAEPGPTRPTDLLRIQTSPRQPVQGETIRILVWSRMPVAAVRLTVGPRPVPLYPLRQRPTGAQAAFAAFAGTSPETPPGRLRILVESDSRRGRLTAVGGVTVLPGRFGVRRLRLDPDKVRLLDPALVAEEQRRVGLATARPLPNPLWTGAFLRPVAARIASPYGLRSVYNGVTRGYHLGVDFDAPPGTPVRAAQRGLVVLAGALPVSGLTVILDHGAGVFSTYQHLSVIAAAVGRRVKPGAIIGRVGSTGLSTGPHLHWGMRVQGVRVDPLYWTR